MNLVYRKLDEEEIAQALAGVPGWTILNGQLSKEFAFGAYLDGPAFAVKVGEQAEELNHHPDILITWCKVRVSVNTHDVGGISPFDFELARRIDALEQNS
jgi:4a-hydroxytetrahydrobiopterin dehydratase